MIDQLDEVTPLTRDVSIKHRAMFCSLRPITIDHLADHDEPGGDGRHLASIDPSSSSSPSSPLLAISTCSNWFATLPALTIFPSTSKPIVVHLFFLFVFLLHLPLGCHSVRLVALNVPSRVEKGSDLELSCLFDLGNATLYALKWFYRTHEWDRDEQEFFRFTPRFKPEKQVFPLDGIQVDMERSGGGTVYIRNTNDKTAGKYKCEISVEGTFHTVAAEKMMMVFNAASSPTLLCMTVVLICLALVYLVP